MHAQVDQVRKFNRFYTKRIGVVTPKYLDSGFSLAELRTLYEVAHRENPTASEISDELGIDAGYMSRILRGFEKRGLIAKKSSKEDARRSHLTLTKKGKATMDREQVRTSGEIGKMLTPLSTEDRQQLVNAMQRVQMLLMGAPADTSPYILRQHRPGDIGWVIHRHGALYAHEYGFDCSFEAYVAEIAAKFIRTFDAEHERSWIAERAGEIFGWVFLVKVTQRIAQLRLLLVEPSARGTGLGRALVAECVRFAREAQYKKIILWTHGNLTAARKIYKQQGFEIASVEPETDFGEGLTAERWELKL